MGEGSGNNEEMVVEENPLKRKLANEDDGDDDDAKSIEKVAKIDAEQTEKDVGITEFLNKDNPGFRATMKQRYSDFNVYEIDPPGSVVHLDDDSIPKDGDDGGEMITYDDLSEQQKELISEVQFTKIKLLNCDKVSDNKIEFDVTEFSKEKRKDVHMVLKKFAEIDSNTIDKDDRKIIVAKRKQKNLE